MLQTRIGRPSPQPALQSAVTAKWPSPASRGLNAHGKHVTIKAGRAICADGEVAEHCYKIISGFVRTVKLTQDGRRQVCDFLMAGDLVGFEAGEEYSFSAEALTPCTVIQFSRRSIDSLTKSDASVSNEINQSLGRSLAAIQQRLVLLCKLPAKERVAWLLLHIADRADGSEADYVNLPMPRADIADYLGLANETVSRALGELKEQRVIETSGARRISFLDREELEDIRDAVGFTN